jgi:hypothetical protein
MLNLSNDDENFRGRASDDFSGSKAVLFESQNLWVHFASCDQRWNLLNIGYLRRSKKSHGLLIRPAKRLSQPAR